MCLKSDVLCKKVFVQSIPFQNVAVQSYCLLNVKVTTPCKKFAVQSDPSCKVTLRAKVTLCAKVSSCKSDPSYKSDARAKVSLHAKVTHTHVMLV